MSIFSVNLPACEFVQFEADGFTKPVVGVIFRGGEAVGGVPLGGIGTGYIDLNTDGVLGYCTVFNSVTPLRELSSPFLGLAVGSDTRVLTLKEVPGVRNAKEIHYWGHYPVADLEFDLDAPIGICLRAFSPFIPGDSEASNTPAIVFEVRLRNRSREKQQGRIAFSFPGPLPKEITRDEGIERQFFEGEFSGEAVTDIRGLGYALGVIGKEPLHYGAALGTDDNPWSKLAGPDLPQPQSSSLGATVAADFSLDAGESRIIRFVLAWFHPIFNLGAMSKPRRQKYASRFNNAVEVAQFVAHEHDSILHRILAWQEAIYTTQDLPSWLRDCLVNNLYCIAKNSNWVDYPHYDDWYGPGGLFCIHDATTGGWTWTECAADRFFGHWPILFLFPELNCNTIRAITHYQLQSGEMPFILGMYGNAHTPFYECMIMKNSALYVHDVYQHYLRTGDKEFLRAHYPHVKLAINFCKTLDSDGDGLVNECCNAPEGETWCSNNFFEHYPWYGTSSMDAGIWLAALSGGEAIAKEVGDQAFAEDCRLWFDRGVKAFDEKLWTGEYYRLYNEPETGRKSDTVLANQLWGQILVKIAGLPDIFPKEKVKSVISTIRRLNYAATRWGVKNSIRPDGSDDPEGASSSVGTGIWPCLNILLAVNTVYVGEREFGLEISRRVYDNMVTRQKSPWSLWNLVDPDDGVMLSLPNYYHNMILWALPMALRGQDIAAFCAQGGFIDNIIEASHCGMVHN